MSGTTKAIYSTRASQKMVYCVTALTQKYGGQQFGQWKPELGNGCGHLLAEAIDGYQRFSALPPDWGKNLEISCSS
mgnify:FL=1